MDSKTIHAFFSGKSKEAGMANGNSVYAMPCPVHGGKDRNLKYWDGENGIAAKCFSHDCEYSAIIRAIEESVNQISSVKSQIVKSDGVVFYEYYDRYNQYCYTKIRKRPKNFATARRFENGFIYGLGSGEYEKIGNDWHVLTAEDKKERLESRELSETRKFPEVEKCLYHENILAKNPEQAVFLLEGEKDVDNFIKISRLLFQKKQEELKNRFQDGSPADADWDKIFQCYTTEGELLATCIKGLNEITSDVLANRSIYIIPDNDAAGASIAEKKSKALINKRSCVSVQILKFDIEQDQDFSDVYFRGDIQNNIELFYKNLQKAICGIQKSGNRNIVVSKGVEQYVNFPDIDQNSKKPKLTTQNFKAVLDYYNIKIRFNEISKKVNFSIPGFQSNGFTGAEESYVISCCERHNLHIERLLKSFLASVIENDRINPAKELVNLVQWNGVDYLDMAVTALESDDPCLTKILLRRWCIGAIDCAVSKAGSDTRGVFILQGRQFIGKTHFFWQLLGGKNSVHKSMFLEGAHLDFQNKDTILIALSHWIVELGELGSTVRESQINRIKAFLGKKTDITREPYARYSIENLRRTIFCASVNENNFLLDDGGNSRFWTVRVNPKERISLPPEFDYKQFWAQMLAIYRNDSQTSLTLHEITALKKSNDQFTKTPFAKDLIATNYHVACTDITQYRWKTIVEIMRDCGIHPGYKHAYNDLMHYLPNTDTIKKSAEGRYLMPPRITKH